MNQSNNKTARPPDKEDNIIKYIPLDVAAKRIINTGLACFAALIVAKHTFPVLVIPLMIVFTILADQWLQRNGDDWYEKDGQWRRRRDDKPEQQDNSEMTQ